VMLGMAKRIIDWPLGLLGLEIRMKQDIQRATMGKCLETAIKNGLNPVTVIDVGAASGTQPLYQAFPDAHFILIEPLEEFAPDLRTVVSRLKKADYTVGVAASKPGTMTINVHPVLVGSTIYKEEEDSDVNGVERTVPAVTLNNICADKGARPPYLIKVDTQGAELEVLKGAENIIPETDFVIIETSLFEFFKGGPQIYDCMTFMKEHGFVVYDIFDLQYRLLDGAMSQVDIAFVRKNGAFRTFHFYANREQRKRQNRVFEWLTARP
jgi:FkbM family methyltransferase